MRDRHPTTDLFDALESRVLLSGDDHADLPNYDNATFIPLTGGSGGGSVTTYASDWLGSRPGGTIEVPSDTDLFRFLAPGDATVSAMTAVQADLGILAPAIELRDAQGDLLLTHDGQGGLAFLTPDFVLEGGETYYLVVRSDAPSGQWETADTGDYWVFIAMDVPVGIDDGGNGDGDDNTDGQDDSDADDGDTGPDDLPDRDETAHPLSLHAFTGDTEIDGRLESAADSDALSFYAPGDGPMRFQLLSDDPAMTAEITVLTSNGATFAAGSAAYPGAKALVQASGMAGERYTVVVSSPDGSLGDYTLQVDASPALYHYFYPAGYSSPTIDEFVPMVNPNAFEVSYAVYAHYETGESLQVLDMGTMPAHARAGITITSRRDPGASLTREAVPYALELVASGPIGANLGHYDFGATTGEAFTDQLDTRWEFPEVVRQQRMRDLLVYYNPNKQPTDIRFTLLDERGVMHRFTRTLEAERRGGINFHNDAAIPGEGVYAVWIESDEPIVAAQTTFDAANGRGDGHLGQAGGGTLAGAFPDLSTEPGTDATIAVLNASGEEAVVRFSSPAIATPYILRIPARSRVSLDPADLGFAAGQSAPLLYTSTAPITARVMQYRHGDGDASLAATEAGTTFLNGAAWVDPRSQGTYIERLGLVNPARQATEVTVTFLFTDGTTDSNTFTLDAEGGLTIAIDRHEAIVRRGGPTAFSLRVDSQTPILASFVHYDLYLNGGWGTLAAPVGLTVPVAAITR